MPSFWSLLCALPQGLGLHLGVDAEDALRYFGGGSLPLSPARVQSLDERAFSSYARKGLPVVIEHGFQGTNFDVIEEPEKWSCEAIAKRFPTGRMKMEYTANGGGQENPVSLKEVATWSRVAESSGASDPEAPQYAPFYWGVKGADDGEKLWDGKKDLLKQMRKLMQPLPSFLRPTQVNEREILGSPEFWFAGEGAGAKAHMDGHCESTLTLQLAGRKKWRLSWPPNIANGSFAKDGLLADGEPYRAPGGWSPTHSVVLAPGEALLIPPAFVHESRNLGPEECAPSLTFQFADPAAAGFFRHFYPRLRRLGDFNECWERVGAMATWDLKQNLKARLKSLTSRSLSQLAKFEGDSLRGAVADACEQAWPKVLAMVDKDKDGRLTASDVAADVQLQGSFTYHDLDEDEEVSEAEFTSAFGSWLMTEVLVLQEKRQKPKKVRHIEF